MRWLKMIKMRNPGAQDWLDKLLKFQGDWEIDRRDQRVYSQRTGVQGVREEKEEGQRLCAKIVCVRVLVTQSCPTLCDPMDCSPPGSSVHGILQARILEWVAIPSSRVSPWPRDGTQVSRIAGGFFTVWAMLRLGWCKFKTLKAEQTWVMISPGYESQEWGVITSNSNTVTLSILPPFQ